MKNLFTNRRREAVGTMLLETWKLTLLLALAGNLFIKYNAVVGMVSAGIFALLLVLITLLIPSQKSERSG